MVDALLLLDAIINTMAQMHFDIPIIPRRVQPSFFFKLVCVPYLALFRCSFCKA